MTVATEDSRTMGEKKKKKTKRGGKKQSKKSSGDVDSLETSLSELGMTTPKATDAVTISTQDSLQNKANEDKSAKKKRGGKKKKLPDLETSLTEMLTDEDDEVYEKETLSFGANKFLSTSPKSKTKKPGKKKPDLGSALGRLDAPKDFGRDEDDADTFCGLGTVGDNEAPHLKSKIVKSPSSGKSSKAKRTNAMMMPKDDSDSEEEDLFESFDSNPFRMPY